MFHDIAQRFSGEKLTWACVLRRAVFDYALYKGNGDKRIEFASAAEFIFGEPDEDGMSFDEICHMFGWEPEYIRKLTKQLRREDIRRLETNRFVELFDEEVKQPQLSWNIVPGPLVVLSFQDRVSKETIKAAPIPQVRWKVA